MLLIMYVPFARTFEQLILMMSPGSNAGMGTTVSVIVSDVPNE